MRMFLLQKNNNPKNKGSFMSGERSVGSRFLFSTCNEQCKLCLSECEIECYSPSKAFVKIYHHTGPKHDCSEWLEVKNVEVTEWL